jgi:hypothetical protein
MAATFVVSPLVAGTAGPNLVSQLLRAAPGISPDALTLAVGAVDCVTHGGAEGAARRLAVIDYSKPSAERRLWVFDLERAKLLYAERVAHGRDTGDNLSEHFSNLPGSHQSSLGLFRTSETYPGANGYSLRLDGLDPGFNDRARERAIVVHGASYVSDATVKVRGGVGRSLGCPAVRKEIAKTLINTLKGGQYLFAYYPDSQYLSRSEMLTCKAPGALSLSERGG